MKKCFYPPMVAVGAALGAAAFGIWQNNGLTVTESVYFGKEVPKALDGLCIAQISDLHNKSFGENQSRILKKLGRLCPDIIVITGDIVDRRRFDLKPALQFVKGALKIAPVYYVSGNHEAWSGNYSLVRKSLMLSGVKVLENTAVRLVSEQEDVFLLGMKDPGFYYRHGERVNTKHAESFLQKYSEKGFCILLSHRPELFDLYASYHMNLVFTGHAHGGQIRLPFVGGILSPNQGLFPKYTSGSYTKGRTTMFVSRGLGNSLFPQRILNRPEIVVVKLRAEP